jgi:hypothetical protein
MPLRSARADDGPPPVAFLLGRLSTDIVPNPDLIAVDRDGERLILLARGRDRWNEVAVDVEGGRAVALRVATPMKPEELVELLFRGSADLPSSPDERRAAYSRLGVAFNQARLVYEERGVDTSGPSAWVLGEYLVIATPSDVYIHRDFGWIVMRRDAMPQRLPGLFDHPCLDDLAAGRVVRLSDVE